MGRDQEVVITSPGVITSEARDLAFAVTAKNQIPRFARDDPKGS